MPVETAAVSDHEGQRLVTHTVQHDYVSQNGRIARETITIDGTVTTVMDFIYHADGRPFALQYSTDGGSTFATYYYLLNLQGDVVAMIDDERNTVASYTYSAWGEIRSSSGSMANINPLRYRGYYYDTETGFYYLQSRYYDPANHRFINADGYASTGQGFTGTNMFAYCGNDPINRFDPNGNWWQEFLDALKEAFSKAGPAFAVAGGAAMSDTIAIGPGDIAGAAVATGAVIYCFGTAISITIDGTRTLDKPSEDEQVKSYADTLAKSRKRKPVIFPADPYQFNPLGLIMVPHAGTKNGKVITWMDPATNVAVFRWDENPEWPNGPHYHIFYDLSIHFYPGDLVPEPFATNYFPQFP